RRANDQGRHSRDRRRFRDQQGRPGGCREDPAADPGRNGAGPEAGLAAAHRDGLRRERGGDRPGLGRDSLAPGLSQRKRHPDRPPAGARQTGSRRPGGRASSRGGAARAGGRHRGRTAAAGEPEWETKPIRARRGGPPGASVARRKLMALRRKTAYEEWATRYRAGKRAPKEAAATISGMPVEPLYTPEDLAGWRYEEKLRSEEHTSELQSREKLVCR